MIYTTHKSIMKNFICSSNSSQKLPYIGTYIYSVTKSNMEKLIKEMAQLQEEVEKAEQNMELIQNPVEQIIQQDADTKMVKVAKQMDDVQDKVEKEMEQQIEEMSQMAKKANEVKKEISEQNIKDKIQTIKEKLCEAAEAKHEIITEKQLEDQLVKLNPKLKKETVKQIYKLLNEHARGQLEELKHLTIQQQRLELEQDLLQQDMDELKKKELELQFKEHEDIEQEIDLQKKVLQILELKHELTRKQQEYKIGKLRIRQKEKQIQNQIPIKKAIKETYCNSGTQIKESNVMTILDKIKEILQLNEWQNLEKEVPNEKSDLKKNLEHAQYLKDRVQQIQHRMLQLQQIKERAQSIKLQALKVKEQLKQTQKTRATKAVEQQLLQVMQQARDIQQAKEIQKQMKEIQREAKEVEQQAQQKEWDKYYMNIACLAARRSKDPKTPVSLV